MPTLEKSTSRALVAAGRCVRAMLVCMGSSVCAKNYDAVNHAVDLDVNKGQGLGQRRPWQPYATEKACLVTKRDISGRDGRESDLLPEPSLIL